MLKWGVVMIAKKAPQPLTGGLDPQNWSHLTHPPSELERHEGGIDWLTFTIKNTAAPFKNFPYRDWIFEPVKDDIRPRRGYNRAMQLRIGRVDWHEDPAELERLGFGVQFTGDDLARLRENGLSDTWLINLVDRMKGKPSRLDYAVDVFALSSPLDLKRAWENGLCQSAARQAVFVQGIKRNKSLSSRADTFYVGSFQSERLMRCYDKAAEQKVDRLWTRIELQLRAKHAQGLIEAMRQHGVHKAGRSALHSFFSCDEVEWYARAIDPGTPIEILNPPDDENGTDKWLLEQVLPVLYRRIYEGALNLADEYNQAIEAALVAGAKKKKPNPPDYYKTGM